MPLTTTVLAALGTGIAAGPWLRGLLFAHTVAYGQPLRRHCPHCGHPAVATALRGVAAAAPINGRCPTCASIIGTPAGAVEILAGTVVTILAVHAPSSWVLAAWRGAGLLGVALAVIDTTVYRLPDTLTMASILGTVLLLGVAAMTTGDYHALTRSILGAVGLGGLYLIPILSRAGMGRGDGQLALTVGACLGWVSISAIMTATIAAVLLAAAHVAALLTAQRMTRHDPVAYGAFMLLGALDAVVLTA
jgi:leader peptidase (prepilin peptidase)/N-methyltransferase